jgi:hypothetical protein
MINSIQELFLLTALSVSSLAFGDQTSSDLLKKVDECRLNTDNATVTTLVTVNSGDKSPEVLVLESKVSAVDALVNVIEGELKGQKYLITNKGTWFYSPRSKKAIRIPSSQLLFGDAAIGDLAKISFSRDYTAESEIFSDASCDTGRCIKYKLKSTNQDATYQSVVLTIDKTGPNPVEAIYFTASGRMLKKLVFSPPKNIAGQRNCAGGTYYGLTSKSTKLEIMKIKKEVHNPAIFQPSYLVF